MLATLKRVRGAVADRSVVPELTHFCVHDGRIQGTNSRIAIDSPIPELAGMSFTVPAAQFMTAVDRMSAEPTIEVGENFILMKHKNLRVKLPTLQDSFVRVAPNPADWEPESNLLPLLRTLRPFTSTDAARAWSIGFWFNETHVYATNNVCIARVPCDMFSGTYIDTGVHDPDEGHIPFPGINLPVYAIDELLRIGEEPTGFGFDKNAVTFHYADGDWLRTQLISEPWPVDTIAGLYTRFTWDKMLEVPEAFAAAVSDVLPFCKSDGFPVVIVADGVVQTEKGDYSAEVTGFPGVRDAKYNGNMLALVLEHATHMALDVDTSIVPFLVDGGEGLIAALKQ